MNVNGIVFSSLVELSRYLREERRLPPRFKSVPLYMCDACGGTFNKKEVRMDSSGFFLCFSCFPRKVFSQRVVKQLCENCGVVFDPSLLICSSCNRRRLDYCSENKEVCE